MSLTNEAKKEVERLLRAGQKLQAINYLANTFQVSLTDAKTLTEAVELEINSHLAQSPWENSSSEADQMREEIAKLLSENKKLEAIKYVRQQTGLGLKGALDKVQAVEKGINPALVPFSGTGCASQVMKIVSYFFLITGSMLLGGAGITYYLIQESIDNSDVVIGSVVNLKPGDSDGSTTYAPEIVYTWQGQQRNYQSNSYSYPPEFEVGEKVELFVNRDRPDEVYVNSFGERWLVVVIVGSIGGVFLFLGIFMMVFSRKIR